MPDNFVILTPNFSGSWQGGDLFNGYYMMFSPDGRMHSTGLSYCPVGGTDYAPTLLHWANQNSQGVVVTEWWWKAGATQYGGYGKFELRLSQGGGWLFPICTSQIRGIWQPDGWVINPAATGIAPHKGIMFAQPELLKLSWCYGLVQLFELYGRNRLRYLRQLWLDHTYV